MKIGLQVQLSLNAGQKYCRMLQGEHSAILLTFIKLPFVVKKHCFVFFWSGCFTQVLFIYLFSVNKQLADKERVAAALENSHLLEVVNQCLDTKKKLR